MLAIEILILNTRRVALDDKSWVERKYLAIILTNSAFSDHRHTIQTFHDALDFRSNPITTVFESQAHREANMCDEIRFHAYYRCCNCRREYYAINTSTRLAAMCKTCGAPNHPYDEVSLSNNLAFDSFLCWIWLLSLFCD